MSTIDSNKTRRLREALKGIFEESGLRPEEIMRMVEYGSKGYNTHFSPYRREGFEVSYALYFLPEHIPKVFILLNELQKRFTDRLRAIEEIIDVGCGAGTAANAYSIFFEETEQLHLIDRDKRFLKVAMDILKRFNMENVKTTRCDYVNSDIVSALPSLYFFTNTISENINRLDRIVSLINRILVRHSSNMIVVIEPLSKNGRDAMIKLRNEFADRVLMPCISPGACPLIKSDNSVCQYSIRQDISKSLEVVVSSTHRMAKFYYLVLSSEMPENQSNLFRILQYPSKRPYGFDIRVCNQKAIGELRIKTSSSLENSIINQLSPNDVISLDPSIEISTNRPVDFARFKTGLIRL